MRAATVAVVVAMLLPACNDEPAGPPIAFPGSVTTLADGREIAVVGYLLDDGESVRVCEALAESYPPQCGGSSAAVVDLDSSGVDGVSVDGSVRWTGFPIELVGVTDGGTLRYLRHAALSG